jgi:hypothetical protein
LLLSYLTYLCCYLTLPILAVILPYLFCYLTLPFGNNLLLSSSGQWCLLLYCLMFGNNLPYLSLLLSNHTLPFLLSYPCCYLTLPLLLSNHTLPFLLSYPCCYLTLPLLLSNHTLPFLLSYPCCYLTLPLLLSYLTLAVILPYLSVILPYLSLLLPDHTLPFLLPYHTLSFRVGREEPVCATLTATELVLWPLSCDGAMCWW